MPTRVMNKGGAEDGVGCLDGDDVYREDESLLTRKKVAFKDVEEEGEEKNSCIRSNFSCSEESSSIGKNSTDLSENSMGEKAGDGEEVQSSFKGSLDGMEALEEVLPIRRGISLFYKGKSKSFTSLAEASSISSIKDIGKPDNAYIRKRRNLLASSLSWDKNRSSPLSLRSHGIGGGISKRTTSSPRTTLALALAMTCSESDTNKQGECSSGGSSLLMSSPAWRTFSLADLHLQQCVSAAKPT